MKKIFRWLTTVIVIFVITVLHTSSANASPIQDLTQTSAEAYVREALLATGSADLLNFSKDSNDHIIRGTFILQLWNNDPEIQKITNFKIYHAVIEEDIEAAGLSLPFNVEFHNCMFTGRINLESASVKTFRIDDSSVAGSVRMGRMIAEGDLALYQSTFSGEVTLFGADIKNNLFARGSHFNGVKPDENSAYPFEL